MPKTPKKKPAKAQEPQKARVEAAKTKIEAAQAKTAPSKEKAAEKVKKTAQSAATKPAKKVAAKPAVAVEKAADKKSVAQSPKTGKPANTELVAHGANAKSTIGASKNYFYANGKRKTAVASIRLISNGKGAMTVNNRPFENYFPLNLDQDKILAPMRLTNTLKMFDITAHTHGGGVHAQAEAVRHGISKALLLFNPELRGTLKHVGFLTRDSRVKERKKYGLKRARRAPQWAKR